MQNHTLPSQQTLLVSGSNHHTPKCPKFHHLTPTTQLWLCSGWPQVSSVRRGHRSRPYCFDKLGMKPDFHVTVIQSWTKPTFPWDNSHVTNADTPDSLLHKLCSLSGYSNSQPLIKSLPSRCSSVVSVCPSTQTSRKHTEQAKSSRIQHNSRRFSLQFEAAVLHHSACSPAGNVASYS